MNTTTTTVMSLLQAEVDYRTSRATHGVSGGARRRTRVPFVRRAREESDAATDLAR